MRLKGRFAIGFALAALIPIGAAAIGTRQVISSNYRAAFERDRMRAEGLARDALLELERDVARVVESQAQRETHYVGGTLLDLSKYGELPERSLDRIKEQGRPLMTSLAFDVLVLVDGEGRVLDAPHYRPAVGELDPARRVAARDLRGAPFYAREPVLDGEAIRQRLVCEAARTAREDGHEVTVIGGRAVDDRLLEAVRRDEAVNARVVAADGEELVAPERPWDAGGGAVRLPLRGADGQPIAWVEVAVSDAAVQGVLRDVTRLAALLAGGALIATLLLGLWVARRMTRDLDALVGGAQAAARGDLDHEVPVRTGDEIGEVAEAMNTMMADLKDSKERLVMAERVAAWQEIARRLAHEIKNPLTPIQMSVETLRKTWSKKHPSFDEIFEESTQTVLEEAARLKRIVGEFSEFARMPKPEKRPVALDDVIGGALALYQGGEMTVERELAPGVPTIEADPDALHQVLLNLIENARDAMAARGGEQKLRVSTALTRGGKAVAIAIEDSGPGVPAELRDKIFTPYYTTKHARGGTGLGLAIVHRTISDHGGRITVGQSPLGGARFVVELPLPGATEADMQASLMRSRG